MIEYTHFIDGKWINSEKKIEVFNKYTGQKIAMIGEASREIVQDAIDSAYSTFHTTKLSEIERYNILMKASALMTDIKGELANLIVKEVGKSLNDARVEVERAISTLVASAEESKRLCGSGVPLGLNKVENKMALTIRVPVGVIGAITPFNFPLLLTVHKIGPAIAGGNTVVLKPSELTPLISCKLAEIMQEAGLPNGYFNIVNGSGEETGEYLLEDDRIAMFTFTGSPTVGRHIKSKTGIRNVTLELGNNSPNIIHKDAPDINKALELCVRRGFANAGQACISVQRVYIHEDIFDEFVEGAEKIARNLIVGDPSDEKTDIGTMITEEAAIRIEQWVKEAVDQGAKCIIGGKRNGSIFYPTILTDVSPNMKVMCEEVFAPVINLVPYKDVNKIINEANNSSLGLQVGLFTSDINLAMEAAHRLEFGGVIINDVSTYRSDIMPYGGVKDSGIGKEGPAYAIKEMTNERLVVINF